MLLHEQEKEMAETGIDLQFYLDRSEGYFKLQTLRVPMAYFVATLQSIFKGPEMVFSLLFLSLGAALALCAYWDSYYLGFIVVGSFYGFLSVLIHKFKKK